MSGTFHDGLRFCSPRLARKTHFTRGQTSRFARAEIPRLRAGGARRPDDSHFIERSRAQTRSFVTRRGDALTAENDGNQGSLHRSDYFQAKVLMSHCDRRHDFMTILERSDEDSSEPSRQNLRRDAEFNAVLLAMAGHDLRQPLQVLTGAHAWLARRLAGLGEREYLRRMGLAIAQ
jgi:signal transduction histidine kinase